MAISKVFKASAGAIQGKQFKEPIVPQGDATQIIREPDIRLISPGFTLDEFGFYLLTELPSKESQWPSGLAVSLVVVLLMLLAKIVAAIIDKTAPSPANWELYSAGGLAIVCLLCWAYQKRCVPVSPMQEKREKLVKKIQACYESRETTVESRGGKK